MFDSKTMRRTFRTKFRFDELICGHCQPTLSSPLATKSSRYSRNGWKYFKQDWTENVRTPANSSKISSQGFDEPKPSNNLQNKH